MSFRELLEISSVTRRTVLKSMGAVAATAALAGCGDSNDDNNPVAASDDLYYDQAERIAFNTGPFNCGGKCVHKFHVKNNRIFAMTSAGDIPYHSLNENDANNRDEWDGCEADKPMQFRSCVRGYSYINRVYQPDRLKYPLIQTGEKGDLTTFKRISWEDAYKAIGEAYVNVFRKYDDSTYRYVPAMDRMGFVTSFAQKLGYTYIRNCSNASNGNSEAAKLDAVGGDAFRNSKTDNLNAGFILIWGSDPTRNSNHENGSYWPMVKAKEAGIPMVTVSPVCTDNAAIYSKSIRVTVPSLDGVLAEKTVNVPGWVPIRPGTDGALLVAMMYVIYRRKIYDLAFLDNSNPNIRKCFGFWQGDSVASVAPAGAMGGYPNNSSETEKTDFNGKQFTLAADESFEEYLVSLENKINAGGWIDNSDITAYTPALNSTGSAFDGNADIYAKVLAYAAKLTGVSANAIEALAYHYAKNGTGKASKIDCGCGPQRQYSGAEFVWLVICLTAICGYTDKLGGGPGIGMGSLPDNNVFVTLGANGSNKTTGTIVNNRPDGTNTYVDVNDQNLAELVFTGRDGRSVEMFRKDSEWTSGKNNITKVEIDLYTSQKSNRMTTHSNINKTIEAFRQIGMVIVVDDVMTPTAAHANIVLPAATNWEDVGGTSLAGQSDVRILKQNVLRETMYDSKRDGEISANMRHYAAKALIEAGFALDIASYPLYTPPADIDNMIAQKTALSKLASSDLYDRATGGAMITDFSWDDFVKTGRVQLNAPQDKPIIGLKHYRTPGGDTATGVQPLLNTTGYINFYSPFWGKVRNDHLATLIPGTLTYTAGWRSPVAKYVPVREGYETFFTNNNPLETFKGVASTIDGRGAYKLQFLTNKARNRAHTCQDNVAIIKDQFLQKVYINPIDAHQRGISDGDTVYIYNDRGCTKIPAAVTDYIVPGTISIEHGAWYRASTDPKETVTVRYQTLDNNQILTGVAQTVPVDVGGAENILTDDLFIYDPQYISQTASCHAGPCEVSLIKPN